MKSITIIFQLNVLIKIKSIQQTFGPHDGLKNHCPLQRTEREGMEPTRGPRPVVVGGTSRPARSLRRRPHVPYERIQAAASRITRDFIGDSMIVFSCRSF